MQGKVTECTVLVCIVNKSIVVALKIEVNTVSE